ncbi:MAG: hypothetical protein Q9160_001092 [Pyrenula sp. 1 TL-2023]
MYYRSLPAFLFFHLRSLCLAHPTPNPGYVSPSPVNEDLLTRDTMLEDRAAAASAGIEWGKVASTDDEHGYERKRGSATDTLAPANPDGDEWKRGSEWGRGNEWKRGSEWGRGNEWKRGQDWLRLTDSDGLISPAEADGNERKRAANPFLVKERSPVHNWASPPPDVAPSLATRSIFDERAADKSERSATRSIATGFVAERKRDAEAEANRDDKPYR